MKNYNCKVNIANKGADRGLAQCNGIDLFKFIFALLIVAIHVPPLTSFDKELNHILINIIARVAVPFYFVSSGYLLFRKTKQDEFDLSIPLKYAFKIFRLYIIWSLIYFPLVYVLNISTRSDGVFRGILTWIKTAVCVGSFNHLWYLHATIVATLMLCFVLKMKIPIKAILALAIVLYAIGLIPQTYTVFLYPLKQYDVIWRLLKFAEGIIITTRNGVFEGFLFMSIGMLFAWEVPVCNKRTDDKTAFALSLSLLFLEAFCVKSLGWAREFDMYIFLVPVTVFLFNIALNMNLKESKIYKFIRIEGSLIFYIHVFVKYIVDFGFEIINRHWNFNLYNSLLRYIFVLVISAGISIVFITVSNKKGFLWLKKIYQ